jgi:MFS family permease
VTVVGLNLGSPLYLDAVAPEKLRSTAQGVLSMVGNGIAGIASNLSAGWLMDRSGVDSLYLLSGVGALALGALACWILPLPDARWREAAAVPAGDQSPQEKSLAAGTSDKGGAIP